MERFPLLPLHGGASGPGACHRQVNSHTQTDAGQRSWCRVSHTHLGILCGSLCEYCLLHLLLKNNPEMFSQHFIEAIFHFNSYTKHKSYNKFSQSDR